MIRAYENHCRFPQGRAIKPLLLPGGDRLTSQYADMQGDEFAFKLGFCSIVTGADGIEFQYIVCIYLYIIIYSIFGCIRCLSQSLHFFPSFTLFQHSNISFETNITIMGMIRGPTQGGFFASVEQRLWSRIPLHFHEQH